MPRIVVVLFAAVSVMEAIPAYADDAKPQTVTVTGARPIPGLAVPRNEIPAAVQAATSDDIARSRSLDTADFMNRTLGSVYVNEMQGNPFQNDVNYRGYTASPLLGTPQGISVFMDGVRMNQPFGDVVSWDLIPKLAIRSITLIPGSNPLFGLNALGGALSIETKDGLSAPGTSVLASAGSNSRRALELEHGGNNDNGLHWYAAGDFFKDEGWRPESSSGMTQLFAKLGWRGSDTNVNLSVTHADNRLGGNGLQEQRFLERDWRSIYTKPDITGNRSTLLNLTASHELDDKLSVSGNAYYRRIDTSTFNSDINNDSLDQALYQPNAAERDALASAGYQGYPLTGENASNTPFPYWRCIAQVLRQDEPAEKCNGLLNRSNTNQQNYGMTVQANRLGKLGGRRNQFTGGAAFDVSHVDFAQGTQLGYLNPDRSVTGLNAFADGVSGGNVDGAPFDSRVDVRGQSGTWSLFASDVLSLADNLRLTLAGRYNRTHVHIADRINPGGGPDSLDGNHRFSRFNPGIGITFSPVSSLNVYAGYNEGARAPSAIELGCANPDRPCKLPNSMAGDPPLRQVVTRTWEAGFRGETLARLRWNAGVFSARNSDDILFVADEQAGYGYFKNFGKTRRQGLELGLNGSIGRLSFGANYTYLDATFQSAEIVNGSSNSSNDQAIAGVPGVEGTIRIRPGDRIPLIPRHIFKLNAGYKLSDRLDISGNVQALSGVIARGNENGLHQPDNRYYLGPGRTAGYAIFNLGGTYTLTVRSKFLFQVNNLFDKRYTTAAQLGPTGFDNAGNFISRPFPPVDGQAGVQQATFYAPGAPRLFWAGIHYSFDRPER